jgi:2-polyprenyl-3-methyl-5-hydroxy-6-metoxy-1,4-benzoquinol methylase
MEHLVECPLCLNSDFKYFLTCIDHTTSKEKFHIVKCSACDFLITNPRPTQDEIGQYYKSDKYISHTGNSKSLFDKLYHAARNYTLRKKRKLIETKSGKKSILDYGCGTGEFITYLKKNNWSVEGVEPTEVARQKASQLSAAHVHSEINQLNGKTFDVITLWHVIEHVHALNETISKLSELLDQEGKIFIAVPNPASPDAKKYGNFWAAYDVPRHLWHFNKENMKMLLTKNGLKLIEIKPMILDSYYVSILSEEYQSNSSTFSNLINGFLNGLKSNLAAKATTNYSSLIYIAGK